jgi:hypothetical protein
LVLTPFALIDHSVVKKHFSLAMHEGLHELTFVNHFLVFELHLAKAFNKIMLELSSINSAGSLKFVDTNAVFKSSLEITFVNIAVFVLYLSLAMDLSPLKGALVLRTILKIDHSLPVLGVIFPFTDIHISIRVLAETVSLESAIDEMTFVADTAIFHKHAKTVVLAITPLSFIVLALILPDINTVPVKIILIKFAFVAVTSFLEYENSETMHDKRQFTCRRSL